MRTFISRLWLTFLCALAFQGCATTYLGSKPNLSLRGNAAEEEFQRFKSEEGFFGQRPEAVQIGPSKTLYTTESFKSIIHDISPRAYDKVVAAQHWRALQNLFIGVLSFYVIGTLVTDSRESFVTKDWFAYSAAGGSIVSGIMSSVQMAKAACHYNEDLRSKLGLSPRTSQTLAPALRLSFAF